MNPLTAAQSEELPAGSVCETMDLLTLVEHREAVQGHEKVGAVFKAFSNHGHEYVAVTDDGKLLGLCSRGQIGYLLGSRFGFSIFSDRPIRDNLMEQHLRLRHGTPVLAALETALSRTGEQFYDDVALVNAEDQFLGMISVARLIHLQSCVLADKAKLAEKQRCELEEKNRDLFRSLHELRQSQGCYAILFTNAPVGVALLDSKGGIETANQRLLSFVDPESSSAQANLAALVVPEERDNFLRLLDHTEEEGGSHGPHSTELHLALAGRGRRLFKCTIGWIRETGQICVFLDDITEQRVMERQMAQKEKSALLDSLVGGIAHELNNKLTPVLGFSQMISQNLRKQPDTAKLHEFAQTITESAIESAKIIRQLLQMSRPPARELVRCDLRAVVQDALTLAKFKLREDGIQPRLELPPAEVPLIADPAQLKQVVVNIVFNAVDVMDNPDRRELKLRVTAGRGQAALLIADTGHGIQPEHLNRIFDPFFTTKSPDRGTGLGLSVCFSIVKQHGGEINVESTPGEGTTFTITLPQADDAAATAPTPPAEDTSATTARVIRARILVVDDEPFVTRLVQEMLRSETDCKVEWAADGVQATERLKDSAFDLVISDIRMPRMNGFQLLDWIKGHFPPMAARFIFMTGDAGSVEMNGALDELGVPVLRKPFSANSLLDHCRSLIRP